MVTQSSRCRRSPVTTASFSFNSVHLSSSSCIADGVAFGALARAWNSSMRSLWSPYATSRLRVDSRSSSEAMSFPVAGADAHSRYYSEDVQAMAPGSVELVIVPDADHVDLYDRKELIPFDKLDEFFTKNLAA